MYANIINDMEENAIRRFGEHPVLAGLSKMPNSELEAILFQKRVLALEYFEPFYNTAIVSLLGEKSKEIARSIVVEEYPPNGPNHRENAVEDLRAIGIDESRILTATPTAGTRKAIDALRQLVAFKEQDVHNRKTYEIRALMALRFGGEVLAGEEFALLCPELERRYGLTDDRSEFYWPHLEHDRRNKKFGEKGDSHSDKFGEELAKLINSQWAVDVAALAIEDSFEARSVFYDQFQK